MALPNSYEQKSQVRCTGTYTDQNDAAVDPTVVVFKYKNPAGTITSLTYGVNDEVVKDGTGIYHVDVDGDTSGTWYYRFESTGTAKAGGEEQFEIYESEFD